MTTRFKLLFSLFIILIASIIVGCGKPGEDAAETSIKKNLKPNQKYEKINYELYGESKLGKLTYKLTESKDKSFTNSAYFEIKNEKEVKRIPTTFVPKKVLEALAIEHPDTFKKDISTYRDLDYQFSQMKSATDDIDTHTEEAEADNYQHDQLWQDLITESNDVNSKIFVYRGVYESAPDYIQKYFSKPPQYYYYSIEYDKVMDGILYGWIVDYYRQDSLP